MRAIALVAWALLAASAPAQAADMTKTLRVAFPIAENGFDPQAIYDDYSDAICRVIFDPLYRYDYFARPVKMIPNTAEGLPEITDGGRTYTIKVKPGIYFASDPAFGGKKRELTAADYVYSMKRILDPEGALVRPIRVRGPADRRRRGAGARAQEPARSTTTRRSKACRRSTATRCGSASASPSTASGGGSRRATSPRSRAKSSRSTATNRIA